MTFIGGFDAVRRPRLRLHLRRLADAPRVEGDPTEGTLRLRGVVCAVCAARTESALAGVPGVERVAVDLEGSQAMVRLSPGAAVDVASLQRALEGVVVGMSVRRLFERVVARLTGRTSWQRTSR